MFVRTGCYKADTPEEADLVVFGGGSDLDPKLYREERHGMTFYDSARDDSDMLLYLKCLELGIPMMGVCRGAQFLHVMNGGKLFQDVDGHYGPHKLHVLGDCQLIEKVSSVHHQSCIQNVKNGMKVLAVCHESKERWLNDKVKETGPKPDIEAFFYRDTGCFGVQGHPEYAGYNKYTQWCLEQINDLFLTNPDYEWSGSHYRMRKDLVIERTSITNNEPSDIEPEKGV
jgi:gamma-glutamyl-gamma-aminobutyrate hydrolase PuuD